MAMDCECTRSCEESIRRVPLVSMGIAAAGALVASRLPVGALLRLAFALAKPALLVFGIIKVAELCREKCGCEITPDSPGVSSIQAAVS